jgi:hypothetical protein
MSRAASILWYLGFAIPSLRLVQDFEMPEENEIRLVSIRKLGARSIDLFRVTPAQVTGTVAASPVKKMHLLSKLHHYTQGENELANSSICTTSISENASFLVGKEGWRPQGVTG